MNPTIPAQRELLVGIINKAAEEIYTSTDLDGSHREQVFSATLTEQQVAFPYYVGRVRGVRHFHTKRLLTLEDFQPRYQTYNDGWMKNILSWRIKHKSALARELSTASRLVLSIPLPEDQRFSVFITGSTANSDRVSEEVVFNIGDVVKQTSKQFTGFPGIRLLRKDSVTAYNLSITDVEGSLLAVIPNSELESRYTIVHVTETAPSLTVGQAFCYEVLYKLRFTPFQNDYDEFPCEGYDKAIYWKTMEHITATREGQEQRAILANQKCESILAQIAADSEVGKTQRLNYVRNRFIEAQELPVYGGHMIPPPGLSTSSATTEVITITQPSTNLLLNPVFDFIVDLREFLLYAPNGVYFVKNGEIFDDGQGGIYTFNPVSLTADNGRSVLKPDNLSADSPGRYEKFL